MPNTKDLNVLDSPTKLLLVSQNGAGKSILAASFHKAGKIHFEDGDIRMKPVAAYYPGADISYDSWTSDNFSDFVKKIHNIIDGKFRPDFKTWVLDSMTSFSITAITYQLKMKDKIKTTKGGLPATSWEEINGETVLFHEILEAANILYDKYSCNVIFTAHPVSKTEMVDGKEDGAKKKITSLAAYGTKIPSIVPGFFDEIYNIELIKAGLNKWDRIVHFQPHDELPGKTALFNYLTKPISVGDKNFYEEWKKEIEEGKKKYESGLKK